MILARNTDSMLKVSDNIFSRWLMTIVQIGHDVNSGNAAFISDNP